jgi:hypothetical protein
LDDVLKHVDFVVAEGANQEADAPAEAVHDSVSALLSYSGVSCISAAHIWFTTPSASCVYLWLQLQFASRVKGVRRAR